MISFLTHIVTLIAVTVIAVQTVRGKLHGEKLCCSWIGVILVSISLGYSHPMIWAVIGLHWTIMLIYEASGKNRKTQW